MTTEIKPSSPEITIVTSNTSQPEQDLQDDFHDLDLSFPSSKHNARPAKRSPVQSKKLKWRAKGKLRLTGDHCYLLELPDDVLRVLLTRIPPRSLKALGESCRELREILREESIWRDSYVHRFVDTGSAARREDVRVLVQSCLGDSRGWKKEGLLRESMLERWTSSKAIPVPHHPPVGLIHSLSLSYPSPTPPVPLPLVVGKTHHTPSRTDRELTIESSQALLREQDADASAMSTPIKMTHRQKYDALIAATTRPAPHVLSAGLGVGGVVRSDPLSGKVSKGFWGPGRDANFHLRPHLDHHAPPTAIHLSAREQTFVLWGLLTGMVVHTTVLSKHSSTPGSRANSINVTCDPSYAHDGEVLDIFAPATTPADSLLRFVTGGADGKVKYWEVIPPQKSSGKRSPAFESQGSMTCLYTSNTAVSPFDNRSEVVKLRQNVRPDPIVLVRCERNVICGVTEDGDLRVWWDVEGARKEARVDVGSADEFGGVKRIEMDVTPTAEGLTISVLIHHRRAPTISRYNIIPQANGDYSIQERKFVTPSGSPITSLEAYLAPNPPISVSPRSVPSLFSTINGDIEAPSPSTPTPGQMYGRFIAAGDNEGSVWIWPWDGIGVGEEAEPIRGWNAMDRKITSIDYHCGLIAIGSCDAYIKVFDPLSTPPSLLRSFRVTHLSPADTALAQSDEFDAQFYSVNQIILENDLLVASVGRKVFCWKAGSGKKRQSDTKKGRSSTGKISKGIGKTIDMRSVHEDAFDTEAGLREDGTPSRSERQQVAKLEEMGLQDPDDALQYALMLSMEDNQNPPTPKTAITTSISTTGTGTPTEGETSDQSTSQLGHTGFSDDGDADEAIRAVEEYRRKEENEMKEIMEMIRLAEEREKAR